MAERPVAEQHAFIAHVPEDEAVVDRLRRALEANGITVDRALSDAPVAIVVCVSGHSVGMPAEALVGRREDIPRCIPVRLSECALPPWLSSVPPVDLFDDRWAAGITRLIDVIRRAEPAPSPAWPSRSNQPNPVGVRPATRLTAAPRLLAAAGALTALIVAAVLVLSSRGSGQDAPSTTTTTSSGTETTGTPATAATAVPTEGGLYEPTCPDERGAAVRHISFTKAPPTCIDLDATYIADVTTSRGDFEITLDPSGAPLAVNSFVFLARWHFYDGVAFDRVIGDYLAQVGDPPDAVASDGTAGYLLPEELPYAVPYYPQYAVALANGTPVPNTTGSQFFVITGDGPQTQTLLPTYSRIGEVTAGQDVIDAIDETGGNKDVAGTPTSLTTITAITVSEG